MNISEQLQKQKAYFQAGNTLPIDFRLKMLRRLYREIQSREEAICQALAQDLGKSDYESYMCEVGLTLSEISYFLRHTRRLSREKTVWTPLAQFAARSYRKPAPYGNTLIMSPWNYPFLLTLEPLSAAIAAGNTAMVKPSAYAPHTAKVIGELVRAAFPPELVTVITGGRAENAALLQEKFDFIFFTGSQAVGKEVLRKAAEHLTPVVLELGGKSPCIVDDTANISLAARRIVFGKFLNCGQTCVAPDYILCDEKVLPRLVEALKQEITKQFGENPLDNPNYGKIINDKHFTRILGLLDPQKTVIGGNSRKETQQIAPTVMTHVTWEDPVMLEEIFGPILPILTYRDFDEIYGLLANRPKPLALYLFSQNRQRIREVSARLDFGGGCINDTIIHLATSHLPFGGVGESGMGSYHGKAGFAAFSHQKAIVDKKTWLDLPMRYGPYKKGLNWKLVRLFLR